MEEQERKLAWSAFCGLDERDPGVAALAAASVKEERGPGVALIEQGDVTDAVYLVVEGELKTVLFSAHGHEIWLDKVGVGDVVGEMGALFSVRRTSSVIAIDDVKVLSVDAKSFQEILKANGRISYAFAILLGSRLQRTTEMLAEHVAMPVTGRLHAELIRLGKPHSEDSEIYFVTKDVSVSRLSVQIHATREATSRAMSELKRRGMVKEQGTMLSILAPHDDRR